ncbi:phosphoribosylglycinamide formyltransferase [Cohnella xylanilytica]|uniref:Phosphoribosylglycinamide formyltransferase n=1 Tax=Cohnella xylanilytica TaxID=557555 RepID=A0A841U4P8_9BACL|nr:phosphoribosylglycinamide formyltransferase [Cohnella xylanilytica]MBB6694088.1 phosphoribosylglycinamide formyltransferase [Cohnella xylanilytica]GIO14432.1 phosphoribosylglycinamide formyltransferase [Cohnella xylanilytica]
MSSTDSRLRIAVFASGSGSNFQALAEAIRGQGIPAELALLVCDKPAARVAQRAEALGVPAMLFNPKDYPSREAYEEEIVERLQAEGIGLIVLAGYMRLITDTLVKPYYGRIINIHPALLPAFPGVHAIRQALEYGVKLAGVTVHFVDGGMDTGPIIAQRAVEVLDEDTEESLAERIHAVEHELLPETVRWIAEGRVTLNGRIVNVRREG